MAKKRNKNLSHTEIHAIYEAQVDNVKELKKAWNNINRAINEAYRSDDLPSAKFQTKLLSMVFCAYAEASFSKLIHTPYGFNGSEINKIKSAQDQSIVRAWNECLRIATNKIPSKRSNHVPNIIREIKNLITAYIEEPSHIRNKIAHGQWLIALNSENTKINQDLSGKINNVTVIDLMKYKAAFERLSSIIEDIVESPEKAHFNYYWQHISDFHDDQKEMSTWTLTEKIKRLKQKKTYHK